VETTTTRMVCAPFAIGIAPYGDDVYAIISLPVWRTRAHGRRTHRNRKS
jgi:hypothetical protein